MTDHNNVPTVATGDWIDAAWMNQYIGDNFRAIFQGLANAGSVAYAVDSNTVGELLKPGVDSFLKNTSAGTPSWVAATDVFPPVGSLLPFGGSTIPTGWLTCDGAAVSRTTYAGLFAALGVTWGAGNGTTTFNLPDGRGRAFIGAGTGTGLTNRVLGASVGNETHALTTAEMPAHTHSYINQPNDANRQVDGSNNTAYNTDVNQTSGSTGGDGAHNNMQPSFVGNWIVKT